MTQRSEQKAASRRQILDAAAARIRREGVAGAGIAKVMRDAGLTHGGFYVHFHDKDELTAAAFRHALVDNRKRWTGKRGDRSWRERLLRLAKRYLTPGHRNDLENSCALSAVASDVGRGERKLKQVYQEELQKTLLAICAADGQPLAERYDDAIAFMALCVGGVTLSRAVADPALSERVLRCCQEAAGRLVQRDPEARP